MLSMTVGGVYRDMYAFKLALASHAVKYEFHYDIEKSDTGTEFTAVGVLRAASGEFMS